MTDKAISPLRLRMIEDMTSPAPGGLQRFPLLLPHPSLAGGRLLRQRVGRQGSCARDAGVLVRQTARRGRDLDDGVAGPEKSRLLMYREAAVNWQQNCRRAGVLNGSRALSM
jgi:hypothetical protein